MKSMKGKFTHGAMPIREKRRLVKAIAVAVEIAYRRGFHHGFIAGGDPVGTYGVITERNVSD